MSDHESSESLMLRLWRELETGAPTHQVHQTRSALHRQLLTGMGDDDLAELDELVAAVTALEVTPRSLRWSSLAACVIHAAWGEGRDDADVRARVQDAAVAQGVDTSLLDAADAVPPDGNPLEVILSRFRDDHDEGSPRDDEIGRVETARTYACVLLEHGVERLDDVEPLMRSERRFAHVDATLRALPGDGHRLRTEHLWMLAGENGTVRPGPAVQRWVQAHDTQPPTDPDDARLLIAFVAARLTGTGRPTSAWEVHHAIWRAATTHEIDLDQA